MVSAYIYQYPVIRRKPDLITLKVEILSKIRYLFINHSSFI